MSIVSFELEELERTAELVHEVLLPTQIGRAHV